MESPAVDPIAPFRHRDYRLFVAMVFLTTIVQHAQGVAIGWDIYERTHSALALGWAGLAQFAPIAAFFLPAGQIADTHDRRRVVAASLLLWSVAALVLAVAAYEQAQVFWIYVAIAATGAAQVLNRSARDALLPKLVPIALFPNAVAWNASLFQIAAVAGPALAGTLIALRQSATAVYMMNLACLIVSAGLVLAIRHRAIENAQRPRSVRDLFAGILHVWKTKLVLGTLSIDLFAVLLGGATALLPIYAKDILDVGPSGLGWLSAATAIGASLMAITQSYRRRWRHAGRTFLWAVAVFGAATILFGLSRSFWLSMIALVVAGAVDNLSAVLRQTVVQLYTPDALRGRVSAVNRVFISSSNELGALESGLLAAFTGPVFTVVFGGIATILIVAAGARLFPDLRRLERLPE